MGVVTGYGRGVGAFLDGLSSGRSAVREHRARMGQRDWLSYRMAPLHETANEMAADLPNAPFVQENQIADDVDLVAIADAVRQAIGDARLTYDPQNNDVGIVVTHESPGLAPHVQSFFKWGSTAREWLRSSARFNPPEFLYRQQSESVYRLHSFLYVHCLSALFQCHGFTLYNNNACSSGAFSLEVAADRIRRGEASAVVVAGGDVPEDGTKYRWFRDRGLYSVSGECRPFSARRDGLVLGSGAAALVLEDLDQARAAGKRIWAEWLGGSFASDGWKVTLPDVASGRYGQVIARALTGARVAAEKVTLISPHGIGADVLDRYETMSLAKTFGDAGSAWPAIMPLKGAIGHSLGGCVLVETVGALLALDRGEIPSAARVVDLDPTLPVGKISGPTLDRDWVMLKCTNGFAGQNAAIVLRAAPEKRN